MLQQQPEKTEVGKNVIKTDEPINPENLSIDTFHLADHITKILSAGAQHFTEDQPISKISPTNIPAVVQHAADVMVWIDHVYQKITSLSRNHSILCRYLEMAKKAMEEATVYNGLEPQGKKRRHDPVEMTSDGMEE